MSARPPEHLAGTAARGLVTGETVSQYELGQLRNFVYLAIDWSAREAVMIDTQLDPAPLDDLERAGLRLRAVLLTHSHHDHVPGLAPIRSRHPGVPILLHATEHFRIERAFPREAVTFVDDGEAVAYGGLRFHALHTPGHSAGAITWLLESGGGVRYLFTGDTVFIRDCGRTDLPTGDTAQMFTSLRRLRALAEEGDAVLLPGHHYAPECASTLARELVTSPPFRCRSVDELAALP